MILEMPSMMDSIISEINAMGGWRIIAYNNDNTSFSLVFYILKTVVPLEDQIAYNLTLEIHEKGEAIVYHGDKEHCDKIGLALDKISIKSKVERD